MRMEESTDLNSNSQLSDSKTSAEKDLSISTEADEILKNADEILINADEILKNTDEIPKNLPPPNDGDSTKEICLSKSPLASPKSMSDVDEAIEDFIMADNEESNLEVSPPVHEEKDSNGLNKPDEFHDSDVVIVLEDLKADSDDECLIVEDDSEEITIKDDDSSRSKASNLPPIKELGSEKNDSSNRSNSNNDIKSNDDGSIEPVKNQTKADSACEPFLSPETTTDVLPKSSSTSKPSESSEIPFLELASLTGSDPNETVAPISSENVETDVVKDKPDVVNSCSEEKSCSSEALKSTKPQFKIDRTSEAVLNSLLNRLEIETDKLSYKIESALGDCAESEAKVTDSSRSNPKGIEAVSVADESKDPKKRKKSNTEESSDQILKRLRDSSVDVEITVLDSEVDDCVSEKVSTVVPPQQISMIKTKIKYLDAIARDLCLQAVNDLFKKEIEEEEDVVSDLEKRLQSLDESLICFKLEAGRLLSNQQETFKKNNHDPLVHTRTVGVNVKIVRDCDLVKPVPQPPKVIQLPLTSQQASTSYSPVGPSPRPQVQVSQKPSVVQRVPAPKLLARNRVPTPRARAAAPNVTMTGQALAMAVPGVSRAKAPTPSSGSGVIDLTDDESSSNKGTPAQPVSKLPVPQNQTRLLVPLNSFIQVLPNGQTIRQAMIPPGLSGKSILQPLGTCFMANNVGGVRGPVLPPPSQMPTTYFVQLPPNTNPSAVKGMVPRTTRLIGMPPPAATTPSTLKPSQAPPSTAAPLMLIPHNSLTHPAPFPRLESTVPLEKLPPKPSLKGSRAPNGIILSWNMSGELSKSLVIANYQLFAYQEGPGQVSSALWKKVGDVQALPLPMACTLTQFTPGHRYYFAVRAVNTQGLVGPYSAPVSILYTQDK